MSQEFERVLEKYQICYSGLLQLKELLAVSANWKVDDCRIARNITLDALMDVSKMGYFPEDKFSHIVRVYDDKTV